MKRFYIYLGAMIMISLLLFQRFKREVPQYIQMDTNKTGMEVLLKRQEKQSSEMKIL